MSNSIPSIDDFNVFIHIHSKLSDADFATFLKFIKAHKSLSFDEQQQLLRDEFPELYDKLLTIGGNFYGSTTV